MVWFKVDDSFHAHPKVLAAEPAALGLWVVAGAWSSANLTDGFVPDSALPRLLPDAASLAEQLRTAGLWARVRGGYRFHDWGDYNPTSESVRTEREAAKERMRKRRAEQRKNEESPGGSINGSSEQQANVRDLFGGSSPSPTRTRTSSSSDEELLRGFADEFWPTYPRHVGKAAAEKAWIKARKAGAPAADMVSGAHRYAADCERKHTDPQYVAHPATWINTARWNDEYVPAPLERAKFAWEN